MWCKMERILKKIERINDVRQWWKVKHKLLDIVMIVLFATLANADEWEENEDFAHANEEFLRGYLELPWGIPSHDTIQRVMAAIDPKYMQAVVIEWNEIINSNESEKLKKIINIDGKAMRGTGSTKALHVVSAYSKDDGICFGQTAVQEKHNEIVAIPELLDELQVKNCIVTIDAMGTQTEIAKKIISKSADYVLALKGNQGNLHEGVRDYFNDEDFLMQIKNIGEYSKTVEKARSQIETREYYQTDDISWIDSKSSWKGLKTIGMVKTTIKKDDKTSDETRYYISSLAQDISLFEKSVRQHWAIESMHWQLDVTFREDANRTLDKTAAQNMNIMRKFAMSILKIFDIGKKRSLKHKRYMICANSAKFLQQIMCL